MWTLREQADTFIVGRVLARRSRLLFDGKQLALVPVIEGIGSGEPVLRPVMAELQADRAR